MIKPDPSHVDLLVLGAGWTATFLLPLLYREDVLYAATTTDGRDNTIPFRYNPDSDEEEPYKRLPAAKTVVITFPLKGRGQSARLTKLYRSTHKDSSPNFVQLGATSIWTGSTWQDDNSPYDTTDPRAIAEDELLEVADGAVLNLAGLYGGARQPHNWVDRVVRSKSQLRAKGALHLIHGEDVARAILALHRNFTPRKRWLLSDMHVYDWWDLIQDWAVKVLRAAEESPTQTEEFKVARQRELLNWVGELLQEEGVKALPRDSALLGRVLDGRAFWNTMKIWPIQGRAS